MKKRAFIKNLGAFGLLPFSTNISLNNTVLSEERINTEEYSEDEFWSLIRSQYKLHPDFINLESGYYNIIPQPTLEKHL